MYKLPTGKLLTSTVTWPPNLLLTYSITSLTALINYNSFSTSPLAKWRPLIETDKRFLRRGINIVRTGWKFLTLNCLGIPIDIVREMAYLSYKICIPIDIAGEMAYLAYKKGRLMNASILC